jgi:hypothetical protein
MLRKNKNKIQKRSGKETWKVIKKFRLDNGGEFISVSFKSIIKFIHGWGSKKKNNDSKIFLRPLFTNNICEEQI